MASDGRKLVGTKTEDHQVMEGPKRKQDNAGKDGPKRKRSQIATHELIEGKVPSREYSEI
jgi:hypothetical protein